MATTRQRTTQPIIKAWNAVKGLDYSDKPESVTMIIESVKNDKADDMTMEQMLEGYPYKRHTKAELIAMLDEAEAEIAAGKGTPHEEVMCEMHEEIERWEQEELEMVEMV